MTKVPDRSRSSYRTAIVSILREHLSHLQRRLRGPMVEDLVSHVLRRDPDPELFLNRSRPLQIVSIILHLRHSITDIRANIEGLDAEFRATTHSFQSLVTDAERRMFLEHKIKESGESSRAVRADLKALDRHFNFDCLRERHVERRHRLAATCEVALDFMGGALQSISGPADPEYVAAREIVQTSDLASFLLARLEDDRWQSRMIAARALLVLPPQALREISTARLLASISRIDEHPWVRGLILEVAWSVAPDWAARTTRSLLTDGISPDAPRDFLARRQFLMALAEHPEASLSIVEEVVQRVDPSEHVRLGICELVAPWAIRLPQAVGILAKLASDDASPSVRAHAMRSLLAVFERRLELRSDAAPPDVIARIVCDLVSTDSHPLPLHAACEAIVRVGNTFDADAEQTAGLDRLRAAMTRLHGNDVLAATVQEAAAAARVALEIAADPNLRSLRKTMAKALGSTSPGGRVRLTATDSTTPDFLALGKILANLSREGFGLECKVKGNRLTLYRGDRKRRRAWRVLHELRNPAPNKRQGFRHTVGRFFRGPLRAHPGHLDEVTPTVVPGERVYRDAEGGWGRHLPLVDDILSLPLFGREEVKLFSSHGYTSVRASGTPFRRWLHRWRISWRYAALAGARLKSLDADDENERAHYTQELAKYGVDVSVSPYPDDSRASLPGRVKRLFRPDAKSASAIVPFLPTGVPLSWESWPVHIHYFFSLFGNGQEALAVFLSAVFALVLGDSHRRLRRIAKARDRLPLSIGGWGTRGKSGTERLKAGLFHGLGYEVFCKTTGCEAMFIHAMPDSTASETFVFRPYGKATIWEQRKLLEVGAAVGCQVFLWECMALNPRYVNILQASWMKDDYSTLTNAYPDHEDIQGPTGADVANAITEFIPRAGTLVTSEINFLPLFEQVCKERGTKMIALDEHRGDLLGRDLLALFPYDEHPRNIALVAELAREIGIDPYLAIVTMADHVIPDLGVLKIYPEAPVLGRRVRFINGCSANERTGFLTSWRRTGCADMDADTDPDHMIITVVNNRDDRISRSEVFARILVEDIAADRHVLIGTNIRGLRQFIDRALTEFLQTIAVVRSTEMETSEGRRRGFDRLGRLRRRLRVPPGFWEPMETRLRIYLQASGHTLRDSAPLRDCWLRLGTGEATELVTVKAQIRAELVPLLNAAIYETNDGTGNGNDDDETRSSLPDVVDHFVHEIARQLVFVRIQNQLERLVSDPTGLSAERFNQTVRDAYQAIFLESVVPIEDPTVKGDFIIRRCAKTVPPGTHLTLMGTQNIKGTGLDFVYRWLALQKMTDAITQAQSSDRAARITALTMIETFEDHGAMDLERLRGFLRTHVPGTDEERAACERIARKIERMTAARGTTTKKKSRWRTSAKATLDWLEGWIDAVDSVVRYHQSDRIMKDLIAKRISHERATVLMREIYAREKGGWLAKHLLG